MLKLFKNNMNFDCALSPRYVSQMMRTPPSGLCLRKILSQNNNDDDLVLLKGVPEREVCAEDPVHGTLDDRAVSCQPAGTSDDHDERGEQRRRNGDAANHHSPSLRHMNPRQPPVVVSLVFSITAKTINQNRPAV